MFFLIYNMKDMEFKKGGHEVVRTEWEGGDMHCFSWVKMEMKVSKGLTFLSHLGRNVLLFGSFSHLCLILEALSGCGKSRNCNRLLETSFEYHSPFIHNCTTYFCFVIFFIYDNMDNFFNITLHCWYVSQATAPYMIFIKLLFIKYALLVISLKIIKALVWSFLLLSRESRRLKVVNDQE